jgi:hypothetical protein
VTQGVSSIENRCNGDLAAPVSGITSCGDIDGYPVAVLPVAPQ